MEEGADLPMLVTTLRTFYAKMGYPEVRVRPAYFPYTEPSLEVEVRWRGKWLELAAPASSDLKSPSRSAAWRRSARGGWALSAWRCSCWAWTTSVSCTSPTSRGCATNRCSEVVS